MKFIVTKSKELKEVEPNKFVLTLQVDGLNTASFTEIHKFFESISNEIVENQRERRGKRIY